MTDHKQKNTKLAMLTYLVFFAPQFTTAKNDEFVMYHQKQAIGLLLFAFVLQGIISILGYWGGPQSALVWPVRAILIYLLIMGMMAVQRGETKLLPWIGKYAERAFSQK